MSKKLSDFERLEDEAVVGRYIRYIIESSETVAFFCPKTSLRLSGLAKRIESATLTLEVEIDDICIVDLKQIQTEYEQKRIYQMRIQFALNEAYFFANSEIMSIYERRITLRLLLPIFKLQRRDAIRIRVSDSFPCKIKLGEETYTPTDLSATGLSLNIPIEKQDLFHKQDIILGALLTFQSKNTSVDLEIKSIEVQKKSKQIKIGIRFLKLATAMEQEIAREAYLYTQKIWSRWI